MKISSFVPSGYSRMSGFVCPEISLIPHMEYDTEFPFYIDELLEKGWSEDTKRHLEYHGLSSDSGGLNFTKELGLHSFNLPPGFTCPGASEGCNQLCFGKFGQNRIAAAMHPADVPPEIEAHLSGMKNEKFKTSARAWVRNFQLTHHPEFVNIMNRELSHQKYKDSGVRIHSVGDFYNSNYLKKWVQIAHDNPDVSFLAYTKSWRNHRDKEMIPLLKHVEHHVPNLTIRQSVDWSMHDRPEHYGLNPNLNTYMHGTHDAPTPNCKKQLEPGQNCHSCQKCHQKGAKAEPVTLIIHPKEAAKKAVGLLGGHYAANLPSLQSYMERHPERKNQLLHPSHPLSQHAQFISDFSGQGLPGGIPEELYRAPGVERALKQATAAKKAGKIYNPTEDL